MNDLSRHGIQINYVGVKELHFDSERLPTTIPLNEFGEIELSSARSNYDAVEKRISVFSKFSLATKKDDFHMRVEIIAEFRVDESLFPAERVEEWASKAAHFVLFPYLREQVSALSMRVGLMSLTLPMFTVPTYKVEEPSERREIEESLAT